MQTQHSPWCDMIATNNESATNMSAEHMSIGESTAVPARSIYLNMLACPVLARATLPRTQPTRATQREPPPTPQHMRSHPWALLERAV